MTLPTSHFYRSHQLRLHYVDWGNAGAPPLLLVHGGLDHCRSMDALALALRDDFHIVAPDLRGHGDSDWARGSSYPLGDWVADIAALVDHLNWGNVTVLAHSLGGIITLAFAGIYPERVARIVNIEGIGIALTKPDMPVDQMMREWIEQLRDMETWQPRRYATLDLAIAALRQHNAHLRLEQARQLAVHGTKRNADGSLSWKFDNYQRVRSPYKFSLGEFTALLARIDCPVLLVQGAESSSPARSGPDPRRYFRDAKLAVIAAAGHWVHHDQPADLLAVAGPFLRAP